MLGYFLEEAKSKMEITLAYVESAKLGATIPPGVKLIVLPENQKFSAGGLARQISGLCSSNQACGSRVLHGWAARDWELTAISARILGAASMGSLHDHPQAGFISRSRQRLMRSSSILGLDRIICVSNAVKQACLSAGYEAARLRVIHNGLKISAFEARPINCGHPRLGFLGGFSEGKGVRGFFEVADLLSRRFPGQFDLAIAGGTQDEMGDRMMQEIAAKYGSTAWWPHIRWCGWVADSTKFLRSIDVLICPSTDFDSFPTVLLEAGQAGIPSLATRVGGVPEIIVDGETGWIVGVADWCGAADILARSTSSIGLLESMGERARRRLEESFTVKKMVAEHLALYSELME